MSNRAKGLLVRIWERLVDGPKCPNCGHDTAIHDEGRCLGSVEERGMHVRWCGCTSLRKGEGQ